MIMPAQAAQNGSSASLLYSEEAEKAVLGCMMAQPLEVIPETIKTLDVGDFFVPAHREIFGTLRELFQEEKPIEVMMLHQAFVDRKIAQSLGSPGILAELLVGFATHLHIGSYIRVVKDKAMLRRLHKAATGILSDIEEMPDCVPKVMDRADYAIKAVTNGHQEKTALTVRSVAEILDMKFDDSDNMMGDRVMAAGQNVTLLGPGGIGKSRLALQLALCTITGRRFLDLETHGKGKRWLFLQTENSCRRLQDDLRRMIESFKPTAEECDLIHSCLMIHTIEKDGDAFLNLENGANAKEVAKLIEQYDPFVVVFDPLNTFTALDLNSDQEMRAVVTAITQLTRRGNPQRIALVLHHSLTGKAGAQRAVGWDKSSYGRNSKVLQAWTRGQMNLAPRDPDDSTQLLLSCGKNNNGAMFPDMGIRYDDQAGLYGIDPTFDAKEFREEMLGEKPKVNRFPVEKVTEMVRRQPMKKVDLVKAIMEETGMTRSRAYDKINAALDSKLIKEGGSTGLLLVR